MSKGQEYYRSEAELTGTSESVHHQEAFFFGICEQKGACLFVFLIIFYFKYTKSAHMSV